MQVLFKLTYRGKFCCVRVALAQSVGMCVFIWKGGTVVFNLYRLTNNIYCLLYYPKCNCCKKCAESDHFAWPFFFLSNLGDLMRKVYNKRLNCLSWEISSVGNLCQEMDQDCERYCPTQGQLVSQTSWTQRKGIISPLCSVLTHLYTQDFPLQLHHFWFASHLLLFRWERGGWGQVRSCRKWTVNEVHPRHWLWFQSHYPTLTN